MNTSKITEGITLHMIPFKNSDQIITLFSPEGVLKLFCHRGKSKQRFTPLMKVEAVYKDSGNELFPCQEISLLNSYQALRNNLTHLQVACDLLKTINASQFLGKPAPLLYQLLTFYLDKIPLIENPFVLSASFKLKVLKHEGLLHDLEHNESLFLLAHAKSFQQLSQLVVNKELNDNIDSLFLNSIN